MVVDPVLVATSGDSLAASQVVQALKAHLFPLATLITPNLPEASALLGGRRVDDLDSMKEVGASVTPPPACLPPPFSASSSCLYISNASYRTQAESTCDPDSCGTCVATRNTMKCPFIPLRFLAHSFSLPSSFANTPPPPPPQPPYNPCPLTPLVSGPSAHGTLAGTAAKVWSVCAISCLLFELGQLQYGTQLHMGLFLQLTSSSVTHGA